MSRTRELGLIASLVIIAACRPVIGVVTVPAPAPVAVSSPLTVVENGEASQEMLGGGYVHVPERAAAILGCDEPASSAVCEVASPNAEEDSAFHAEGTRLTAHLDPRCRKLGGAILANVNSVRMYRKALIRYSGPQRLYGVGHTYEMDDTWMVRVARRLDDLNERTLDEKKRTLRHEMSHTIGATENRATGWSAEDYANACA